MTLLEVRGNGPGLSGVEGLNLSRMKLVVKFAYAGESISDRIKWVKLEGSMLKVNEGEVLPSGGGRLRRGDRRE